MRKKEKESLPVSIMENMLMKIAVTVNEEYIKLPVEGKKEYVDYIVGDLKEYILKERDKLVDYYHIKKRKEEDNDCFYNPFHGEDNPLIDYKFAASYETQILIEFLRLNVYVIDDLKIFKYFVDRIIDVNAEVCGVKRG